MRSGDHIVVLPDTDAVSAVASQLLSEGFRRLDYPSGRPWVMGDWHDSAVKTSVTNRSGAGIFGISTATQSGIDRVCDRASRAIDLRYFHSISGSSMFAAWNTSCSEISGSASGLLRIFYAQICGHPLVATSSRLLARLAGAHVDDSELALRLLDYTPHPLHMNSMWREVEAVPPGSSLRIDLDSGTTVHRWWDPPQPIQSRAEGALHLRSELERAVSARTRPGGPAFGADLSGGLDSTPICYLAGDAGKSFAARTMASRDPEDRDTAWAQAAAEEIPVLNHIVVPAADLPLFYDRLETEKAATDEPASTVLDSGRQFAGLKELRGHGAEMILTGIGGDHLFSPPFLHVRTSMATRPIRSLRRLRESSMQSRWPFLAVLYSGIRRSSYSSWLAKCADLVASGDDFRDADFALDWDIPPRLPPWATQRSRELVATAFAEKSDTAGPMHPRRGVHADWYTMTHGTRITRILDQSASQAHGVHLTHPYFDDRVIEAAMSIDPLDRSDPWNFKILVKEAMHDVLPPSMQGRQDKGAGGADKYAGLKTNRASIENTIGPMSLLAERGLIDPARATESVRAAPELTNMTAFLDTTLSCELWLRNLP